jgi:translation initiation factor 2B subunit (eIF-2B alpha/beta/delta family)
MTFSESDLLYSFLEAAYLGIEGTQKKEFEVYVCETAPLFSGHLTAKKLQNVGI